MKKTVYYTIAIVMAFLFSGIPVHAEEWRFPVGVSYVRGLTDVRNDYRNSLEAQGYAVGTNTERPFGVSFQPYVQFDNGFGIGGALGPYLSSQTPVANFYALPVGLDIRYTFAPAADTSPYVRVGGRYNLAMGKFVEHASAGLFGAVGVEFFRKKTAGVALELAYDASTVKLKEYQDSTNYRTETVRPSGFLAGIFAVFSFDSLKN
jgi:hypothetical protein